MIKSFTWIGLGVLLFCTTVNAANWTVVPEESEITAVGILNGKERVLRFSQFDASIVFDPADLANSSVSITFDVTQIEDELDFTGDVVATLMDPTWFDGEAITEAQFVSETVSATPDGGFEAEGKLTIKNIENPITVPFTFESSDGFRAIAESAGVTLNRMDFELGKDWSFPGYDVDEEVLIKFKITATAE